MYIASKLNDRLFIPELFNSREQKSPQTELTFLWNFRFQGAKLQELFSLRGTFAPQERLLNEISFHGTFASVELLLPYSKI